MLPPVDIVPSPLVTTPRDLVDYVVWRQLLEILALGIVFFLHRGTPCNTFTSARKEDGGPPPLRSAAQPLGLDALSLDNANRQPGLFGQFFFLERAVQACFLVFSLGGDFLIENPLLSLLWLTPQLTLLVRRTRAFHLDCDQCAFGTPWKKPTKFVCSSGLLPFFVQVAMFTRNSRASFGIHSRSAWCSRPNRLKSIHWLCAQRLPNRSLLTSSRISTRLFSYVFLAPIGSVLSTRQRSGLAIGKPRQPPKLWPPATS